MGDIHDGGGGGGGLTIVLAWQEIWVRWWGHIHGAGGGGGGGGGAHNSSVEVGMTRDIFIHLASYKTNRST